MLLFIIDTQLPPKLAPYLNGKGSDAIHTTYFQDGHLLMDTEIIKIASSQNRIVVTKDGDFLDYFMLKGAPPKLLLLQLGNITNKDLFAMLELHWSEIVMAFEKEAAVVIVNSNSIITY